MESRTCDGPSNLFSILDEDRKMKRNKNEEGGKRSKNSIGFFLA